MAKIDEIDMGTCGNCTKLRWNRRRLGLSQGEFAKKVGLTQPTISKLERDETAWAVMKTETVDKIMEFYASMTSWQPERADKIIREINEVVEEQQVETEVNETEVAEVTEIGKHERLKQFRNELGISQHDFGVKVGLSAQTIRRLERDENAWEGLHRLTVHKIESFYSNNTSDKLTKQNEVIREINEVVEEPQIKEEVIMAQEAIIKTKPVEEGLHKNDDKTLALIEFAYEELTQAETHEDFVISMQMLKKIVNRY